MWDNSAKNIIDNHAGIVFGGSWLPGWMYVPTNQVEKARWTPFIVPSAIGKEFSTNSYNPVATYGGTTVVESSKTKYPEAIIKINNYVVDKFLKNPDFNSAVSDGKPMDLVSYASYAPLASDYFDMLVHYDAVNEALKTSDPSKLNKRQKKFYDQILAYKNDKDENFIGMNGYMDGQNSSLGLVKKMFKKPEDLVVNAYLGPHTDNMAKFEPGLLSKETELFTNIIANRMDLEEGWKEWTDYWSQHGGDKIDKDVNDWFKNKAE